MPGPDLDVALRRLAIHVHGAEIARSIDLALDTLRSAPDTLRSGGDGAEPRTPPAILEPGP
jgi:hypothetical protein